MHLLSCVGCCTLIAEFFVLALRFFEPSFVDSARMRTPCSTMSLHIYYIYVPCTRRRKYVREALSPTSWIILNLEFTIILSCDYFITCVSILRIYYFTRIPQLIYIQYGDLCCIDGIEQLCVQSGGCEDK